MKFANMSAKDAALADKDQGSKMRFQDVLRTWLLAGGVSSLLCGLLLKGDEYFYITQMSNSHNVVLGFLQSE